MFHTSCFYIYSGFHSLMDKNTHKPAEHSCDILNETLDMM